MLDRIDRAHEDILDGLRELGFRSSSMDLLRSRVENISASSAESLSLIQDTDIAEAILQLQQQDLAYRASLQVGARVLQTSLMNYLS